MDPDTGVLPGPGSSSRTEGAYTHRGAQRRTRHRIGPCPAATPPDCSPLRRPARHRPGPGELPATTRAPTCAPASRGQIERT